VLPFFAGSPFFGGIILSFIVPSHPRLAGLPFWAWL